MDIISDKYNKLQAIILVILRILMANAQYLVDCNPQPRKVPSLGAATKDLSVL